ncbi:MAG: hypothetical protein FJ286_17005 [Planctomycetes bacterium]|nr:hypothetical protein [Planctomycetota bacterium]
MRRTGEVRGRRVQSRRRHHSRLERLEPRTVLAVNVPPIVMVPGAQTTVADTPLAFTDYRGNQISVADPDASANQVTVTLSVDTGTLTLLNPDPGGGLTYSAGDGTNDTAMTFMGTVADINTALRWVSYKPVGFVPEPMPFWPVGGGGNGHWYEYIATNRTWEQARADAQARGGYLATITSAAENNYVFGLFGSSATPWLGGYQDSAAPGYSEPAGGWRWVTGEPWSYTSWAAGEPNNGSNAENVLRTGSQSAKTWIDAVGTATAPYVIEYDSDPRIPPFTGTATLTVTINDMGDVGVGGQEIVSQTVPITITPVPAYAPSPTFTTFPWVLDDTFDGDGRMALSITAGVDYIANMQVLPTGKILAVGAVNDRFAIMRFNADFTLDDTFGDGGGKQMDFGAGLHARSFVIDSQGRIIAVGGNRVVRFTAAGAVDTTFGTAGVVVTDHVGQCHSVKVQADGRVVVVGRDNNYFRVTRYSSAGVADANWQYDAGGDGGDWGRDVILRDDGDILLVGRGWAGGYWNGSDYSAFSVVRIDANGTQEAQYWAGVGNDAFVNSALPLPDGKFLLIGRGGGDLV